MVGRDRFSDIGMTLQALSFAYGYRWHVVHDTASAPGQLIGRLGAIHIIVF